MAAPTRPRKDPAHWEARYVEGAIPWDTDDPDQHLQRVWQSFDLPRGKALDVGCGTGTQALWLAEQGFDVLGIDWSETAVEHAKKRAEQRDVACEFMTGDFLEDPLPAGSFALVYDRGCFHVHDEADDRKRFAARAFDLLRPAGIWHSLIGSTDGPPRDSGPPRLSAWEIVAAVEPFFEVLQLESTTFDDDKHAHARAWCLVAQRRDAPR